jgi:hypothetical protein
MRTIKLLVLAGLIGGGGYFAWAKMIRPPQKRACARLSQLCDGKVKLHEAGDEPDSCDEYFDELKRTAPDAFPRTTSCVTEARSCGQAVGCMTGGAVQIGTGFVRDFAEGLNQSLKR